ncbi:hypothetical protein QNO07_03465 [Streptomyces sp. 549]|uniref:hypothetical protein n=1 Tax=Streptomyces sp. 549 TaxID=3049076 RepID=UPI0024C22023|nr:hypothetical protein [Streptomyces sp. 549]MDK1472492.1 hypothetical protein [Streptomyces sp. 549]
MATLSGGAASPVVSAGGTFQIGAATPGEAVDVAVRQVRIAFAAAGVVDQGVTEVSVTPGGVDPRTLP